MALTDRLDPKYLEFLRNGKPLDELMPTDETGIPVPTPTQMGGKEFRYDDLNNVDSAQNTINQGILRNFPESQKAKEISENPIQKSISAYNESSNGRDTDAIKAFFDKQKKDEHQSNINLNDSLNMPNLKELTSPFPNSPQSPTIMGNPNYEQDYAKYNEDVANQKKSSNQFLQSLLDKKDDTPLMLQAVPEELRNDIVSNKVTADILQKKATNSTANSSAKSISDNALKSGTSEISEVSNKQSPIIDDFERQQELARQQDNEHNLLFGLLKAAQMGGSALAGTKANTEFADAELSKNNEMTNQLKTNMDLKEEHQNILDKNRMRDPNSDISKQGRAMLAEVYPELLKKYPNISAAEMDKMGVNMGQLASVKENIASRKETARMHNETLALAKSNKMDEYQAKRLENYRKDRDPMTASIKSNLGKEVNKFTQSTHALELVHGISDLDKVSPMQKRELAVALATMVSPGLPHEATIAKLDESTLNDEIAHRLQQLTGKPAATNTKGLTKQLIDSVQNQRRVSHGFISKYQSGVDASYAKDIKQYPDAYSNVSKFQTFDINGPESTTISKGQKIPLTGKGIPGRTFTHEGRDYKVDPDGKSATEI